MGLFDLFSPLFSGFDLFLKALIPPMGRLIFWGIIGSVLSMGFYKWLSPQEKILQIKKETVQARARLVQYDGDFEGLWPLIRQLLKRSFQQIGLVLGPAVIASFPLIFLLVWLNTAYHYQLPIPNSTVDIQIFPTSVAVDWGTEVKTIDNNQWQITWPTATKPLKLSDSTDQIIARFPVLNPVPILHKYQWWNRLIANPNGYLPEHSPVEEIIIALPENQYLKWGPNWMRSAEAFFLIVVLFSSLAIKFIFRIH